MLENDRQEKLANKVPREMITNRAPHSRGVRLTAAKFRLAEKVTRVSNPVEGRDPSSSPSSRR